MSPTFTDAVMYKTFTANKISKILSSYQQCQIGKNVADISVRIIRVSGVRGCVEN